MSITIKSEDLKTISNPYVGRVRYIKKDNGDVLVLVSDIVSAFNFKTVDYVIKRYIAKRYIETVTILNKYGSGQERLMANIMCVYDLSNTEKGSERAKFIKKWLIGELNLTDDYFDSINVYRKAKELVNEPSSVEYSNLAINSLAKKVEELQDKINTISNSLSDTKNICDKKNNIRTVVKLINNCTVHFAIIDEKKAYFNSFDINAAVGKANDKSYIDNLIYNNMDCDYSIYKRFSEDVVGKDLKSLHYINLYKFCNAYKGTLGTTTIYSELERDVFDSLCSCAKDFEEGRGALYSDDKEELIKPKAVEPSALNVSNIRCVQTKEISYVNIYDIFKLAGVDYISGCRELEEKCGDMENGENLLRTFMPKELNLTGFDTVHERVLRYADMDILSDFLRSASTSKVALKAVGNINEYLKKSSDTSKTTTATVYKDLESYTAYMFDWKEVTKAYINEIVYSGYMNNQQVYAIMYSNLENNFNIKLSNFTRNGALSKLLVVYNNHKYREFITQELKKIVIAARDSRNNNDEAA